MKSVGFTRKVRMKSVDKDMERLIFSKLEQQSTKS